MGFVAVAAVYWALWYYLDVSKTDFTGFVMLGALGFAFAKIAMLLVGGSRDL